MFFTKKKTTILCLWFIIHTILRFLKTISTCSVNLLPDRQLYKTFTDKATLFK